MATRGARAARRPDAADRRVDVVCQERSGWRGLRRGVPRGACSSSGGLEGRNIRIEDRWAALDAEALQRFAKELIALQPDLILSQTTNSTAALLQQTRIVPIIFANVADPVGSGFVASLARPGGNVTGFVLSEPTMAGKWLELLKEIAPRIKRAALLFNPATAPFAEYFLKPFKAAALSSGVEAIQATVTTSPTSKPSSLLRRASRTVA